MTDQAQLFFPEQTGPLPPSVAVDQDEDLGPGVADRACELEVRARQVRPLTWLQFKSIRTLCTDLGLSEHVAATTAWLAADPQVMIQQLKQQRHEVVAPGVAGAVLKLDVLTAPIIRAPENLRMRGLRYTGEFTMPLYVAAARNAALSLDLSTQAGPFGATSLEDAAAYLFTQLELVDACVDEDNKYGDDIAANGIRVGGILFPLEIALPERPRIGGWETADCYGRLYFVQKAERIDARQVLDWLTQVPTTPGEFREHPLQERRNALLSVCGKSSRRTPAPRPAKNVSFCGRSCPTPRSC
jgi:hypothetical protein